MCSPASPQLLDRGTLNSIQLEGSCFLLPLQPLVNLTTPFKGGQFDHGCFHMKITERGQERAVGPDTIFMQMEEPARYTLTALVQESGEHGRPQRP